MPRKKVSKIDERTEKNLVVASSQTETFTPKLLKRSSTKILIVALVVFGLLYYFKGLFIVAIVNGQPISRISILQETEKQAGKQTLSSFITKTLIFQEAKKEKVSVEKKEIDGEVKKLEDNVAKQGQNLDVLLQSQGMTRSDLTEQIRLQKIIEKMIGKNITITDKEIDEFMQKNKDSLPQNESSQNTRESVKQQLRQQKMSDKFKSFLNDLQKKAKIYYFVNY